VVKSGDTLTGIADRIYGDAAAWYDILAANAAQIEDSDRISPGQELLLPVRQH
jgi:nucleoid-associated protein YgaU